MSDVAKIILEGKEYELPVVTGTENEKAIDITKLRGISGHITLDILTLSLGSNQGLSPK